MRRHAIRDNTRYFEEMLPSWRTITLNLLQIPIKLKFPKVKSLTTQELDLWLKDPDESDPLLIDARHIEEYELSHLKTAELFTSVQDLLKDVTCHISTFRAPIVVYCSIGYRSADVANSLRPTCRATIQSLCFILVAANRTARAPSTGSFDQT